MKYDKYGEVIEDSASTTNDKVKKVLLITFLTQVILIAFNIIIIVVPAINMFFGIITIPLYAFMYGNFLKTFESAKESTVLPTYWKYALILSPIVYVLCLILVVLS